MPLPPVAAILGQMSRNTLVAYEPVVALNENVGEVWAKPLGAMARRTYGPSCGTWNR